MQVVYLTCPDCGNEFYITDEFAGQGYDWFCPRCQRVFKEHESRPRGASPRREDATGQDSRAAQ